MSIEQNTITGAHLVGSITTGIVVAGSSDDLERGEVDVEWVLNIQSADGPFLDRAEHRRREDRVGVECDLELFAAFGTQMSGGITEFGAPPNTTHRRFPPTARPQID